MGAVFSRLRVTMSQLLNAWLPMCLAVAGILFEEREPILVNKMGDPDTQCGTGSGVDVCIVVSAPMYIQRATLSRVCSITPS